MKFFKTLIRTGLPFGFFMSVFNFSHVGWRQSFRLCLMSGLLFGLFFAAFAEYQSRKFKKNRPTFTNEEAIIKEGPANHFLNGEGVGGWIYLTNKHFYYKSHKLNIQSHELPISLQEVVKAEKANTLGIIPNQLRLTLQNGKVEKFVVNGAKEWVKTIENLI